MTIEAGSTYSVTITSVIDADTFRADFPDGKNRSCRLFGIDAPETVYASSTWPAAFASLPPNLQTQQFGSTASAMFSDLLISGTGSSTPVGLTLNVTVRTVSGAYGRTIVTVENSLGQDVGAQLVVGGYAVVWDDYASTIPALYNIYQSNETIARNANLVMWSTSSVYYPWDYRADVDAAAQRILYIVVDDTNPQNGTTDAYVDDDITVTFSREIESSYLSTDYFKLYRTNSTMTEYEAVSSTITGNNKVVRVDPTINLGSQQYYMLVVVGNTTGIQAIDAATLAENYVLSFRTGNMIRPDSTTDPDTTISGVDIWTDADNTDDQYLPSTDLFASDTTGGHISLISSIPANHSVGVYGLNRISFMYDDDLAAGLPIDALGGRYSAVPIDPDPMSIRSVYVSGVVSSNNMAVYTIEYLNASDTVNREYTFTLAPGVARGVTKTGYDLETHVIKFLGRLTPLYATPDQIRSRLTAWNPNLDAGIIDYDLYKLIHEKSLWTDTHFQGPPTTDADLISRNRLVICLVLHELLAFGDMLSGSVKSRMLLMTQVEYYNVDYNSILSELDDCIRNSLADSSGSDPVIQLGIKSGKWLIRHGKNYGVYR